MAIDSVVVEMTADEEISECLAKGTSFILDAGAGSGKTYSLVLALKILCSGTVAAELSRNGQHIACITYTNVAKDEIIERTHSNKLLRVSTIHDFLWSTIQLHQKALREALIELNDSLPASSSRKAAAAELAEKIGSTTVVYSDRGSNFLEGRLHHDDLLSVAKIVYAQHPRLSKIVASQYPFIFVDEYQDSSASVIDILLQSLLPTAKGHLVLGFFGDKLQNIYHSGEHKGVGEISSSLRNNLRVIVKRENRRCSLAVIDVLNMIRSDISQVPSADNASGDAVYVHVTDKDALQGLQKARALLSARPSWILDGDNVRELYLTNKLIARKAGFPRLLEIFTSRSNAAKENLMSGEDQRIAYFLDRVEPVACAWHISNVGSTLGLLNAAGHQLASIASKKTVRDDLNQLLRLRDTGTVWDVLNHIQSRQMFPIIDDLRLRMKNIRCIDTSTMDDAGKEREDKNVALYEGFFLLPYAEVSSFCTYFHEHTPFSTKHGVKGDEFDTVLVVLDDSGAKWNIYSFDKYLKGEDEVANPDRFKRSRNLFYVCCSRAKKNLAVIDLGATTPKKQIRVQNFFGKSNCFEV